MQLNEEQLIHIFSSAQEDPDEAVRYMQDNNIPSNAESHFPVPDARIPLIFILLNHDCDALVKRFIHANPALAQEYMMMPAMPPLMPCAASISLLAPLFGKGPVNKDMLYFLLAQGCAATDKIISFWGQTELWQVLALSGDVEGLSLLLEASPGVDVHQKIDGFTIFDIFTANSSAIVTWLNDLKQPMQAVKANIGVAVHQILVNLSRVVPGVLVDSTLQERMTMDELQGVISEIVSAVRAHLEVSNMRNSMSACDVTMVNIYIKQLGDIAHQMRLTICQEKIIHQEHTPELDACLNVLLSHRANQTAAFAAPSLRSCMFYASSDTKPDDALIETKSDGVVHRLS